MVLSAAQDYIHNIYIHYLWTLSVADPRTKGWFLIDSPLPILMCIAIYLITVWIGPKLMEKKTPYKLTRVLIPYNLALAALNFYIVIQLLTASTRLKYNYICEPSRHSKHPDELQIVNAVWWFYFSKLLEFSDTLFFILRKKDEQLTFLHVFHHSTMFFFWWIGAKWVPSGSTFLPAMVNSGVHIVMYSYYGLSALGPQVAKYLWWKKYLTVLQLIQFIFLLCFGFNAIRADCQFPSWIFYTLEGFMISFIILFGHFYYKAYAKKGNKIFFDTNIAGSGLPVLLQETAAPIPKEILQSCKKGENNNIHQNIVRRNKSG